MVRCSLARRAASVVLGAILAFCWVGPAAPETLVVPLTGQRVRDIQTAQLFHTLFHDFFPEDDGRRTCRPATFRRCGCATRRRRRFRTFAFRASTRSCAARFAGVIERNARNILTDPYANAFQADYHVWERKWEVDSLAWPVILASIYWRYDARPHDLHADLHRRAADRSLQPMRASNSHRPAATTLSIPQSTPTMHITPGPGMIWGAFRPSDDPVAVSLQHSAECLRRRRAARHRAARARWLRRREAGAQRGARSAQQVQVGNRAIRTVLRPAAARMDVRLRNRRLRQTTISWTTRTFRTSPRCRTSIGARPTIATYLDHARVSR